MGGGVRVGELRPAASFALGTSPVPCRTRGAGRTGFHQRPWPGCPFSRAEGASLPEATGQVRCLQLRGPGPPFPQSAHENGYVHTITHAHRLTPTHAHQHSHRLTRTHTHMHTHTHVHTGSHTDAHRPTPTHPHQHSQTHMHTRRHTHTCTQAHMHTSTHVHTAAHTHTHTFTPAFTQTHVHSHTDAQAHTDAHTHAPILWPPVARPPPTPPTTSLPWGSLPTPPCTGEDTEAGRSEATRPGDRGVGARLHTHVCTHTPGPCPHPSLGASRRTQAGSGERPSRGRGEQGGGTAGWPLQPGALTPDGGRVALSGREAPRTGLCPLQTGAPTGPRGRPHAQRTGLAQPGRPSPRALPTQGPGPAGLTRSRHLPRHLLASPPCGQPVRCQPRACVPTAPEATRSLSHGSYRAGPAGMAAHHGAAPRRARAGPGGLQPTRSWTRLGWHAGPPSQGTALPQVMLPKPCPRWGALLAGLTPRGGGREEGAWRAPC